MPRHAAATIAGFTAGLEQADPDYPCRDQPWKPWAMTDSDYAQKLDELDRLLNDPDVPMQPSLVWTLLAEISLHDVPMIRPGASRG